MRNEPNFQNFQMVIRLVNTRNYNNEQRTMNYSKQTQSNPILSASGGIADRGQTKNDRDRIG